MEKFLMVVMWVSILTTLTTEATKKLLGEKKYSSNLIALVTSVVISVAVSVGYIVLNHTPVTAQVVVEIIALIFFSALSAMLGYDKVKQAIGQIKEG